MRHGSRLGACGLAIVLSATTLGAQSKPGQWKTLFDGKSMDEWRGYKDARVPSGWKIVDDTLAKNAPTGDIVSKDDFGNFELDMEWKIGEAGK